MEEWKSDIFSKDAGRWPIAYCQVFWVQVRLQQEQCVSICALVFYYCISDNIPPENTHCTKKKFSIMDFFSKFGQIRRKLRIWSHLLKKSFMKNFFFCVVGKTIKSPIFYDNAHLHICLICLRLDVPSLTKIQYLQIEPSKKRTLTNESLMLKMFYLCEFIRWAKYIQWAIENNYLLVYKLFEFVPSLHRRL